MSGKFPCYTFNGVCAHFSSLGGVLAQEVPSNEAWTSASGSLQGGNTTNLQYTRYTIFVTIQKLDT